MPFYECPEISIHIMLTYEYIYGMSLDVTVLKNSEKIKTDIQFKTFCHLKHGLYQY